MLNERSINFFNSCCVIAAHPDDEMLGCGGTLARLRHEGARICVLLLGEGPTSRSQSGCATARSGARQSALKAAAILDIHDVRFAGLPDNRFDTLSLLDIVKTIEIVRDEIQPDSVFTHFSGDLNIDHQLTHRAVLTAFRPLPGVKPVSIYSFEVLSSTEYATPERGNIFQPTVYVDIADYLPLKQKALSEYATEMRPWPHPRSHEAVEYLARLRGSQCGKEAAEAFVLCRGVL